ncbi:MAG: ATP-dependent DNA helicase [Rhodospirillales bacterium]
MYHTGFAAARARLPDAPALVVGLRDVAWAEGERRVERLTRAAAVDRLTDGAMPIVCHRRAAAGRLGIANFAAYDLLELFAFVRPARFCVPTPRGLSEALLLSSPEALDDNALALFAAARALLGELIASPGPDAANIAYAMARGGWPWAPIVTGALGVREDPAETEHVIDGLKAWTKLRDWEDGPLPPPPDSWPVEPVEARARLVRLLAPEAEPRPPQLEYASQATFAFSPRDAPNTPNIALIEAGTGIGKTLGYIAPATVWAEKNKGPVWISTHTRNLQRQLDCELDRAFGDRRIKSERVVVRKGRENLVCLLNFEQAVARAQINPQDQVALGLIARWLHATRDGDMIGGDFPAWLADLLGSALTLDLTDRRGECIYSACRHFRRCFIERTIRRARRADIVVANHALVMVQATRADDPLPPTRFIFDEGHHLFDAADSAFALQLTGRELRELREWIGGEERAARSRRRGLQERLADAPDADGHIAAAIGEAVQAAFDLPGRGWRQRLAAANPEGPAERFFAEVRQQVQARSTQPVDLLYSLESAIRPPIPGLLPAAEALHSALGRLLAPLRRVAHTLSARLDDEAARLDTATRQRLDGLRRGVERRALQPLQGWRAMLSALAEGPAVEFADWLEITRLRGQEFDVGVHRHWVDPMLPFARAVLEPAHGVLITSATLREPAAADDDWETAESVSGVRHLKVAAHHTAIASPFDYPQRTCVLVVDDVDRDDPRQVAAALRALFIAAGGGALGLFTAISRLRNVWRLLAGPLEDAGLRLLAQHMDALDTGTLVDIFRAEENACLLGTDALREGIDVPGRSLRLVVLDRVPWPRPTILHRARRTAFGARAYDDRLTRLRLKQAYGRLIRHADDRGAFVVLDRAMPSRLASAFPPGVTVVRTGLSQAVSTVTRMLHG